jgi:hypothetical protein
MLRRMQPQTIRIGARAQTQEDTGRIHRTHTGKAKQEGTIRMLAAFILHRRTPFHQQFLMPTCPTQALKSKIT